MWRDFLVRRRRQLSVSTSGIPRPSIAGQISNRHTELTFVSPGGMLRLSGSMGEFRGGVCHREGGCGRWASS